MSVATARRWAGRYREHGKNGDVLELLRQANRHWSSPLGAVLRELLSAAGGASEFLAQLSDQSGDAAAAPWLAILGHAVASGEASPESLDPRVATVAVVLLRNEFVVRGSPAHRTTSSSRSSMRCTCRWSGSAAGDTSSVKTCSAMQQRSTPDGPQRLEDDLSVAVRVAAERVEQVADAQQVERAGEFVR